MDGFDPYLLEGLVLGVFAIGLLVMVYMKTERFVRAYRGVFTSEYLEHTGRESGTSSLLMRSTFNRVPMIQHVPSKFHTHPVSAALRTTGSNFIERVAEDIGRRPFYFQCSAADQRRGRDGSRRHYWIKDLTSKAAPAELGDEHVLALVDVDYYVNMRWLLVSAFRPTLLYTFQPETVARSVSEYSFTFDARSVVKYRCSGGATYNHPVWNYGTDNLIVVRPGSWRKCRFPQVVSYLVDKRRVGPDHEVICLSPLRKWTGWPALVAKKYLSGAKLERLRVVEGEFLRMYVQRKNGLFVSTGQVGHCVECTLPVASDDALAIACRTNTVKLALPTVLAYVDAPTLNERKAAASVVQLYHRSVTKEQMAPTAFPVEEAVREFDFGVENYCGAGKPTLVAFMSPFIHGAFAPAMTQGNEERCVTHRVTKFAKQSRTVAMTGFLDRVMREFARLLLPTPNQLHPVSIDDVYEKQSRPMQRMILDRSMNEDADRRVRMFMKKEAYGEVKDPRPISQINGSDKRDYSTFIYAIAEVIKTMRWYAFGVPPVFIAQRVAMVAFSANSCVNTDFSRFDGRVSPVLRELERIVLMRAFDPMYAEQLNDLHQSQFNIPAVGRFGTRYETGTARASGSPETAAFNSLANAFVAYYTFRSMRVGGAYLDSEAAWSKLGIYGGDDGLTADVSPDVYSRCATNVGMKLDVEEIQRGDMGIKFLARVYGPDVWHGDPNSCCDLPRQLSKFHTTVSLPPSVTPLVKLLEKARAFYLTDANTPIIGEFVTWVITLAGGIDTVKTVKSHLTIWNSDLPQADQYPNVDNGWMHAYASKSLDAYGFDQLTFRRWLRGVGRLENFLTPPLCAVPKEAVSEVEVIVDGDLLTPAKPADPNATRAVQASRSVKFATGTKFPRKPRPVVIKAARGDRTRRARGG